MTAPSFEAWLADGYEQGWIVAAFCAMHDGLPLTPDESDAFEHDGFDPCMPALRIETNP